MKEKLASFGSAWGWLINIFVVPVIVPAALWVGSQWFLTKAEFSAYQSSHKDFVAEKIQHYDQLLDTARRRQDNAENLLIQILPTLKAIETKIDMMQKQVDKNEKNP